MTVETETPAELALEERVARLERELGRLRYELCTRSVVTESLRIEREDNGGSAALAVGERGNPGLHLLDPAGRTRAMLTLEQNGSPGLAFTDAHGRARLVASLAEDGSGQISLHDARGRVRAVVGLRADGEPRIGLLDEAGEILARVP